MAQGPNLWAVGFAKSGSSATGDEACDVTGKIYTYIYSYIYIYIYIYIHEGGVQGFFPANT